MGKNAIVGGFLLACCLAIYVLATREGPIVRENDPDASREPRLSLSDFTIYKYDDHKVKMTFSGRLANFVDPNLLEIYGNIRGLRHNSQKREYVTAESAVVFFETNGVAQLMEDAEVSKAELEDNVNVGVKYNRLVTDFAEYLPQQELLQSEFPVRLKGPTGDFDGKSGFKYDLKSEDILIHGPISGVLQGAILDSK